MAAVTDVGEVRHLSGNKTVAGFCFWKVKKVTNRRYLEASCHPFRSYFPRLLIAYYENILVCLLNSELFKNNFVTSCALAIVRIVG